MSEKQRIVARGTDIEQSQAGPVKIRFTESKENEGFVELWLDYEKADTPTRAYFADYVSVVMGRADITLIFGRLIPGTERLRSQVEISFPHDGFVAQLWKSTRAMHQTLKAATHRQIKSLNKVDFSEIVHTSRANNVFIAIMGEEAILDFYYIAPSELQFVRMGRRHTVALEPVIRISLPEALVLEFLNCCEVVVSKIPEAQRILEREERA